MVLAGLCVPKLRLLGVAAVFPMVWISGDWEFVRLATAFTGGKLGNHRRLRWVLWVPRIALVLFATILVVASAQVWR